MCLPAGATVFLWKNINVKFAKPYVVQIINNLDLGQWAELLLGVNLG